MGKKTVVTLTVGGMMCAGCERIIEKKLKSLDGVFDARADYTAQTAVVSFDGERADAGILCAEIAESGYNAAVAEQVPYGRRLRKILPGFARLALIAAVMAGLSALFSRLGWLDVFYRFPVADQAVSLGALFAVGFFTSVHCIGMCGGINLSVSVGADTRGTLLYNAGRIVSYTAIGGLAGAIGSFVGFSGTARGAIALAGGVFMVAMGLNMLDVFPSLRVLTLRFPRFVTAPLDVVFKSAETRRPGTHSLIVGLLNGLMPCGPLQAMQLYALSLASPFKGALAMFLFSAGTAPLMLALGFAGSFITRKTVRILMTASGVLVIFLGMELFKTGLSMAGF